MFRTICSNKKFLAIVEFFKKCFKICMRFVNLNLSLEKHRTMLSQFYILSPFQRKGYGNYLLTVTLLNNIGNIQLLYIIKFLY